MGTRFAKYLKESVFNMLVLRDMEMPRTTEGTYQRTKKHVHRKNKTFAKDTSKKLNRVMQRVLEGSSLLGVSSHL